MDGFFSKNKQRVQRLLMVVSRLSATKLVEQNFDRQFYLDAYPDVKTDGIDPVEHYLKYGWQEGRDPCPWFSTTNYLQKNPHLQTNGTNPFLHFIKKTGGRHVLVAAEKSTKLELLDDSEDMLRRIRAVVEQEFNADFYSNRYPETKHQDLEPLDHYLNIGWKEGKNPNEQFSTVYYLQHNPDVNAANLEPFYHYLIAGRNEGRLGRPTYGYRNYNLPFDIADRNPEIGLPVCVGKQALNNKKESPNRIGVHLHAFYMDDLKSIIIYLKSIPSKFDLYVSTDSSAKSETIRKYVVESDLWCNLNIEVCVNRGRDVAPFIVIFGEKLLKYDYVLHIHAKKSAEKEDVGERWLHHNLRCLLKDTKYVASLLMLMELEEECGVVFPKAHSEIVPFMNWGANRQQAECLFSRLQIPASVFDAFPLFFPAGTMFWCRPGALRGLLSSDLKFENFPKEPVEDDGTLAHAIERCLLYIAHYHGFKYRVVAPLPSECIQPETTSPTISVIVPFYNAEPWLHHAIQSILTQKNCVETCEIILVDNCSNDESLKIARYYENTHSNIFVFKEKKAGAGAARNRGIQSAKGEFICFLDADDMLALDAFDQLISVARQSNADLVTSPLCIFAEDQIGAPVPVGLVNRQGIVDMHRLTVQGASYPVKESEKRTLEAIFSDFGPCAKLYRKEFLDKKKLTFPTGVNFEDNTFVINAYLSAETIAVCPNPTYFYRKYVEAMGRTQSTKQDRKSYKDQLLAIKELLKIAETLENKTLGEIVRKNLFNKLKWCIDAFDEIPDFAIETKEELKEIIFRIDPRLLNKSSNNRLYKILETA